MEPSIIVLDERFSEGDVAARKSAPFDRQRALVRLALVDGIFAAMVLGLSTHYEPLAIVIFVGPLVFLVAIAFLESYVPGGMYAGMLSFLLWIASLSFMLLGTSEKSIEPDMLFPFTLGAANYLAYKIDPRSRGGAPLSPEARRARRADLAGMCAAVGGSLTLLTVGLFLPAVILSGHWGELWAIEAMLAFGAGTFLAGLALGWRPRRRGDA